MPQPTAFTMIAIPNSPKPRNPIHVSAPSSAKTAAMPGDDEHDRLDGCRPV